jgi:small subunit ribosomal protein S9
MSDKDKDLTKEKKIDKKQNEEEAKKPLAYLYGLGRRKSSIAQVRLHKRGKGKITVNGKDYKEIFPTYELQKTIKDALVTISQDDKLDVEIKVKGGGKRGQADAIRLGISRALIKLNPIFKKALKKHKYLTSDSRVKERKKPGLKRARRAPQWGKR